MLHPQHLTGKPLTYQTLNSYEKFQILRHLLHNTLIKLNCQEDCKKNTDRITDKIKKALIKIKC